MPRGTTALRKYQRLECRGLWRDAPAGQRREVVVNLGEASVVLSDPMSGTALSHWSLPAVARMNPGHLPALYHPADDAPDTLELDDPDMIAALETVADAVERARPHPGRLRQGGVLVAVAAILALAVFWLPGAAVRHTAAVLPPATRADIGQLAMDDLARLTGAPCSAPAGQAALDRLALRLFGPDNTPRLSVVREGLTGALHLPGNRIVLSEALVAGPVGPDVAAGHALAEAARAAAADPVRAVLYHAGLWATLRLLTTGVLAPDAVAGWAETLLTAPPAAVDEASLLAGFAAAEVPSGPYAYALDPSGESVLGLIEADPWPAGPPRPVLSDDDWVRLQGICAR